MPKKHLYKRVEVVRFSQQVAGDFRRNNQGLELAAAFKCEINRLYTFRRLLVAAQDILYHAHWEHRKGDYENESYYSGLNDTLKEIDAENSDTIDAMRTALAILEQDPDY